ncbi:hypothetical protein CVV38_01395 [Candidatus Peregrinibacteria bacterium HGW-Peregrinibacteria-1]|jgi:hypothetical protein|nr:MAG: hypothetical protein CVV38_01395 [Candidatus Peregrinibacteria bacterium HGW-Peregrinibacteria-1]
MKGFITIQDAAELSGKSVQTIRRAIKAGKVITKKRKTPQGFIYWVSKDSVCEYYGIVGDKANMHEKKEEESRVYTKSEAVEVRKQESTPQQDNNDMITRDDFKALTRTLEKMVTQHSEERQNFLRLVNGMQEKIFIMENKINLLQEPTSKKWFSFWK